MTYEAQAFKPSRTRYTSRLGASFPRAGLLALSLLIWGCKIVILSGPATVATGDTVTYVLELSGDPSFEPIPSLTVDVPVGWQLLSSTYSATVDGTPVSGNGVLVGAAACLPGALAPGFQRLYLEPDSTEVDLTLAGSGEVVLEFLVTGQPSGGYDISLAFGTGYECSPPTIAGINQRFSFLPLVQTFLDDTDGVDGLAGASEVDVSPDGKYLYATGALDASVAVFSRNPATGTLTFLENVRNGANGVQGMAVPLGLEMAGGGEDLYVASLTNPDTTDPGGVAHFSRDAATGGLTFVERFLEDVESLKASPDGKYLYAAAGGVTVYDRDAATGGLHFVETVFPGGWLLMSADGRFLHVVGVGTLIYERDQISGQLTLLQSEGSAASAVLSPDGLFMYTLPEPSDLVTVWNRDDATGLLTYALSNPVGDPARTDFESIAINPDGTLVVLGGRSEIRVYRRNKATGELTPVESRNSFNLPFQELVGPQALVFGPDGRYLIATGGDALVTFDTWTVFQDGFESATTSAWSLQVP